MGFKQQLIFDVTDAETLAASDNVGAFLRSADGTLLTHTDVAGKMALDVRVAEGINVEVDLTQDDEITVFQGTDPWIVSATDLDIRALTAADVVTAEQGTSPWVVAATDLDIRDLSHVSDSMRLGDGTDLITSTLAGAKQALDVYLAGGEPLEVEVNDVALANVAMATGAVALAVADTAENIIATPLANRKYLLVMNNSNKKIFVGTTGVTAANGFPLSPQSVLELRAGAAAAVQFVGADAGQEVRTMELS